MGICVVPTGQYIEEGLRQLRDTYTYTQLMAEPVWEDIWATLTTILTDRNLLYVKDKYGRIVPSPTAKYLLQLKDQKELRHSRFYLLMKVHKDPVVGRPIVSCIHSIGYFPSTFLDHTLQPLMHKIESFIQSSQHLIVLLNDLTDLPRDCVILCADIESLYPNIPTTEGLVLLKEAIRFFVGDNNPLTDLCVALMQWVLQNNYFLFGDSWYHQLNGTAMGTPAAVVYACLVLSTLERRVANTITIKPLFYKRFVDDLFGIFPCRTSAQAFMDVFNNQVPTIKCKVYTITADSGVFLDVEVFKGERFVASGSLDTKVYQKIQNRYLYLPPNSFHRTHVFRSYIVSELNRYRLGCTSDSDFESIRVQFFNRLVDRGYNPDLLRQLWGLYTDRQTLLNKMNDRFLYRVSRPSPPITFNTTFTPETECLKISSLLRLPSYITADPDLAKVFDNANPITCFSNPQSALGSLSQGRKSLHKPF